MFIMHCFALSNWSNDKTSKSSPKKVQLQKYLSVLNQITSEIVELKFQITTASYYHPLSDFGIPSKSDWRSKFQSFRRQGCVVWFVIPLKSRINFKLNPTINFQWNFGYSFEKLLIFIHSFCVCAKFFDQSCMWYCWWWYSAPLHPTMLSLYPATSVCIHWTFCNSIFVRK